MSTTPTDHEMRQIVAMATGRPPQEFYDPWLAAHDATVRADHEKALRERIAQDIEAAALTFDDAYVRAAQHGLRIAARIAREGA